MKLKTKLLTAFAGTALLVPALGSIASCTFSRDPAEYICPTVSYDGSTIMNPNAGTTTFTLKGFKFSRPLMEGESVKVNAINVNGPTLSVRPTYSVNSDTMEIKFTISLADKRSNATAKCKLTFDFTYQDQKQSYDKLDKVFTLNYSPAWINNGVTGLASTYQATLVDNTKTAKFTITGLSLSRSVDSTAGEQLAIDVINNTAITFSKWRVASAETNAGIPIEIECLVNLDNIYNDYNGQFGLQFTFKLNGVAKQQPIQKDGFGVTYDRQYDDPEVTWTKTEEEKVFSLANQYVDNSGVVSINLGTGSFNLNKKLNPDYNETLELSLLDENDDPIPSTKLSMNYSYSSGSGLSVSSFVYHPNKTASGLSYEEEDLDFKVQWRVYEDITGGNDKSGVISGFNIDFTPFWHEKQVEEFGYTDSDSRTYTTNPGNTIKWNASIQSFNGDVAGDKGFMFNGVLDEGETVTAVVTNVNDDDAVTLTSKTIDTKIISEGINKKTYLNFDVEFAKEVQQIAHSEINDHTGSFKLQFIFHKGGYDFENVKLDNTYALQFNAYEQPATGVNLYNTNGDAGDTLLDVTGKFTSNVYSPENLQSVTISSNDSNAGTIAVVDKSWSIDSSGNIYFMVQVNPEHAYLDETFNVKFDFNFSNPKGKIQSNIIQIKYAKFSTDMEEYIKTRTVPLCVFAEANYSGGGLYRYYFDSFILGRTPESRTDPEKKYEYYIATTLSNKLGFDSFLNSFSNDSYYTKKLGLTDTSFDTSFYNYTDKQSYPGASYITNYLYCGSKPSEAMTWINQKFAWSSDAANYIIDLAIAKINFSQSFSGYEGTDIPNRQAREQAYLNKLIELNKYDESYNGHVNQWLETPITSDTKDNYSNFGIGGYTFRQDKWKDETYGTFDVQPSDEGYMTVANWKYQTIANDNKLNIGSISGSSNAIKYFKTGKYDKNYSWTSTSNPTYYHNGPVYYSTTTFESGTKDSFGLRSNWPIVGSPVTVSVTPTGVKDAPIKLAGIYVGWINSSVPTSFSPYIEVFDDGDTNLLVDYI